jgi:hypothetical protein
MPIYLEQLGRALEIARSSFDGANVDLLSTQLAVRRYQSLPDPLTTAARNNESSMFAFMESEESLLTAMTRFARDRHYWQYIGMNLERFLALGKRPTAAIYRLIEEIYLLLVYSVNAYRNMVQQSTKCLIQKRRYESMGIITTDPDHVRSIRRCEEHARDYTLMVRLLSRPGVLGDIPALRWVIKQFRLQLIYNADAAEFMQVYLHLLVAVGDNQPFLDGLKRTVHRPDARGMIRVRFDSVINQMSFSFARVTLEVFSALKQLNIDAYNRRTAAGSNSNNNTPDWELMSERFEVFNFATTQMAEIVRHMPIVIPISDTAVVADADEDESATATVDYNLVSNEAGEGAQEIASVPFMLQDVGPDTVNNDDDNNENEHNENVDNNEDEHNENDGNDDNEDNDNEEEDEDTSVVGKDLTTADYSYPDLDDAKEELASPGTPTNKLDNNCHNQAASQFIYADHQFFWQPSPVSSSTKRSGPMRRQPLEQSLIISASNLRLLCRLRGVLDGGPSISWNQLLILIDALHGTAKKNLRGGSAYTVFLPTQTARFPVRLDRPHPSTRLGYKLWLAVRKILFTDYGVDLSQFKAIY